MIVTSSPVVQQSAAGRTYTGTWREKVRFSNVTDGLSNTFLAGEMHVPEQNLNQIPFNGPVLNGAELDNHSRIGGPGVPLLSGKEQSGFLLGFGSAHPNTCNFVRADGSTGSVSNTLDTLVLANLCHRADGEVVAAIE